MSTQEQVDELAVLMINAFKYATPGQEEKFGGIWGVVANTVLGAYEKRQDHVAEAVALRKQVEG
jgi:hypothetical protein